VVPSTQQVTRHSRQSSRRAGRSNDISYPGGTNPLDDPIYLSSDEALQSLEFAFAGGIMAEEFIR
jgi:hypothetical protein